MLQWILGRLVFLQNEFEMRLVKKSKEEGRLEKYQSDTPSPSSVNEILVVLCGQCVSPHPCNNTFTVQVYTLPVH